jgi:hypothetical protein
MKNDKIKGGLADNKSIENIAKKHKTTVDAIKKAIDKGAKIEMEHTDDKKIAKEIAIDHIFEFLDYYEELKKAEKKMEESTKEIIKRILKEEVNLKVTDETPDTISVLVEYNDRNAGIIMIAPANTDDTIEIVAVKFKKDYETIYIINEAVKSLWGIFKEKNSIIVAPKPEGIQFWNKLGFTRISPNYLILNRGH